MLWVTLPMLLGVICTMLFSISTLYIVLLLLSLLIIFLLRRTIALLYPIIFCFGALITSLQISHKGLEESAETVATLKISSSNQAQITAIYSPQNNQWHKVNHKVALFNSANLANSVNSANSVSSANSAKINIDSLNHTTIVAKIKIASIDRHKNQYNSYLYNRGIFNRIEIIQIISQTPKREPISIRLNRWAFNRLETLQLNKESLALASAMTIARRELLTEERMTSYRNSGTSHIMALSGLHMGIILLLISWFILPLAVIQRGHLASNVISISIIWLFALLAGMSDSIVRAAWMFSLLQFSLLLSKKYASLNSLLTALLFMVIFDPYAIYDLSLQLSFISVAAIILVGVPTIRTFYIQIPILNICCNSIIISCIATVATAPLISYSFGYIALISPLVTLLLLPLLSIIIITTILWIICPITDLAPIFRYIIEYSSTLQNYIVDWFAQRNWGVVNIRISFSEMIASYVIMVIMTIIFVRVINYLNDLKIEERERLF